MKTKSAKRLNPETGKHFKFGDKREDGYFFKGYENRIRKDGYSQENWASPQAFKKHVLYMQIQASDKETIKNNKKNQKMKLNQLIDEGVISPIERINEDTGKKYKWGDKRAKNEIDDGKIFAGFDKGYVQGGIKGECKYFREMWFPPDVFAEQFWNRMVARLKKRARDKGVPFDLDKDFLKSIYPKNNLCPALGIELEDWSKDYQSKSKDNTPSLDRIIPERGYVKENVIYISNKANRIKSDGSLDEIKKIHDWLEKEYKKHGIAF